MPIPSGNINYSRKSAKEIVLEGLQDWIVSGVMKPGEKIVDTELARYFNVSRTPVREALQTLAGLGFVEVVPSCGTQVAGIDPEDVRQCYEMLAEIQATAVRLAAPSFGQEDIRQLEEINEDFEKAVSDKDPAGMQEADERFHRFLAEKSGNSYLSGYYGQLEIRSRRVENLFFGAGGTQDKSAEQHRQIIRALSEGNVDSAEEGMRANWLCTYERVKEMIAGSSRE